MRHFVNISLLFFFATLVASGLMRFLQPFSLTVTRVHIVFGLGLVVLVGMHLSSRGKYFANLFKKKPKAKDSAKKTSSNKLILTVVAFWGYALAASLWNWWPVPLLIGGSYEARNAKEIFRPSHRIAYMPVDSGLLLNRGSKSNTGLRLEFDWGEMFEGNIGDSDLWGDGLPQIAIWTENEDGTVLETLYVTEGCAASDESKWGGHQQHRKDILPVWYTRYNEMLGEEEEKNVDVVSSATPTRDFSMDGHLKIGGLPFVIYAEINAPKDTNQFYHNDKNESSEGYMKPGIGQPSVIYEARIYPSDDRQYYLMDLIGHSGSSTAAGSEIFYEMDQLTTVRKLVDKILLKVTWAEADEPEAEEENLMGH